MPRGVGFVRVLVVVLLGVVFVLLLWKVPEWQATRATDITVPRERVELENELRRTLATVIAGIVVLFSGFVAWRNMRLLQEGQATAREGQITERFTRAIEQLGATHGDGSPRLEVRLGGVYALERIARESATDHGPVIEILTAYVREHAPATGTPPGNEGAGEPRVGAAEAGPEQRRDPERPRADVQAVLTVIGRRTRSYGHGEIQPLDLAGTDLRGTQLQKAELQNAKLQGAHLQGANLGEANLQYANLREANLQYANLAFANLQFADLAEAQLQNAKLQGAQLQLAHLSGARLELARLHGADLQTAYLQNANLQGADLRETDLRNTTGLGSTGLGGARWDETTKFPEGWADGKPPTSAGS